MAKERLKSPRARLFVALDLPDRVRVGIVEWGRGMLADPALRPVRAGSLHVTLAFLGYLPEKEIPRLAEIVEASRAPAPSIELGDPVRGSKRPALVEKRPGPLPKNLSQLFRAVRIVLYRSQIQPQGAHYTPLAQVELPADGRQ